MTHRKTFGRATAIEKATVKRTNGQWDKKKWRCQ